MAEAQRSTADDERQRHVEMVIVNRGFTALPCTAEQVPKGCGRVAGLQQEGCGEDDSAAMNSQRRML